MSLPYTHNCGAVLEASIESAERDYVITFRGRVTQQVLAHCPRCQAPLDEALDNGEFTDPDHRPVPPNGDTP